jgi:trigger factor
VISVQHKEVPELDDDFARSLGDFEDLTALRARVLEDLREEAKRNAEAEVRGQLVGQILEANAFDVPASMVDRYLDLMTGQDEEKLGKLPRSSGNRSRSGARRSGRRRRRDSSG